NGEEYIKIIGRNKEVINVGGEKVLPQEVEGILMQIPFIQDCLEMIKKRPWEYFFFHRRFASYNEEIYKDAK
ncbi:hypothetical protein VWN47_10540, partial [Campylobacter jejuni]